MTLDKTLLELKEYVDTALNLKDSVILVKMTNDQIKEMEGKYPKGALLLGPFVITRNRFPE